MSPGANPVHWFSLCPTFQNPLRCWHLSSLLSPAFLWTWSPFPKSLLPSQRPRPHSRATADIGPVLTLCLCSSALLSWWPRWRRWHQGVFLCPWPEGTASQCEGLVWLDARLPRHLESSTHIPGFALTVSRPACFFCDAGLGLPVFLQLFSLSGSCFLHPQPTRFPVPPHLNFGFSLPQTLSLFSDVLGYLGLFSGPVLPPPVLSLTLYLALSFVLCHCSCSLVMLHIVVFLAYHPLSCLWNLNICW